MIGARCGGYVLAGGRSSRMGTDKALLTLGQTTLIERAVAAVEGAVGSAVVVGNAARYTRFGFPSIEDLYPGAGPLAGIHAALTHSSSDWNLVVACDMPALDVARLRRLLDGTESHSAADVILPVAGGRAHPLCAMYRRSCLPAVRDSLENARYKVLDTLARLHAVRVDVNDAAPFRNVNTPADWNLLLAHCGSGR